VFFGGASYIMKKHYKATGAALRWAVKKGYCAMVRLLLKSGADVHAEDDWALRCAAVLRHHEVVRLLLNYGANVHAEDDVALITALLCGDIEMASLLLEYGATCPDRPASQIG